MTELIVETSNGKVRGIVKRDTDGNEFGAFRGIPYAKPPLGNLRFKDPLPVDNWSEVLDATKYGKSCYQYDAHTRKFSGTEDCLFLNIFVKSYKNSEAKRPVMVWIHGGGFMFGSGNDIHFGPEFFMKKDIVLITINYRLGVFGFLSFEDEVLPGNMGLKDMVLALKWIQTNVENFGGDRNNVTLFGESAGAMAIHHMVYSPLAKGLFHKIICQSGTGFNPWARVKDPKKYAFRLCSYLGKYSQNSRECLDFLMTISAVKLIEAQEQVRRSVDKLHQIFTFSPDVDSKSPNPLITVPVEEAALEGVSIPWLLGFNSAEGICCLVDPVTFSGQRKEVFDEANRNVNKLVHPRVADCLKTYGLTAADVRRMYYGDEKITIANCEKYAEFVTHWHFWEGVHKAIKLQADKGYGPNTYVYQFTYDDEVSLTKAALPFQIKGAAHFDETEYLFLNSLRLQLGLKALQRGTTGYKLMQRMIEMWTNFATYGVPTPTTSELIPVVWEPLRKSDKINYLHIGKKLEMEECPYIMDRFLSYKSQAES